MPSLIFPETQTRLEGFINGKNYSCAFTQCSWKIDLKYFATFRIRTKSVIYGYELNLSYIGRVVNELSWAEWNIKCSGLFIYFYFEHEPSSSLSTNNIVFKFGLFNCQISSSLYISYMINLFFSLVITTMTKIWIR